MLNCKGICHAYHIPRIPHVSPYGLGLVRCNRCKIFMARDGGGVKAGRSGRMLCICCGGPVKTHRTRYGTDKQLRELRIPGRLA